MPLSIGGALHPSSAGPVALGAPSLSLRGITRAGFVGGVRFPMATSADSDITADLMDPDDPATVLMALPLTKGRSWLEQLSDAGNWGITFLADDPALASVGEGSLIRLSLKGVGAVVGVCETTDAVLVDLGEESVEGTSWSGRLHVTLPEQAVVYPSRGVRQKPIQENRNLDYSAPEFDSSQWQHAVSLGTFAQAMAYWFTAPWPGDMFRLAYDNEFLRFIATESGGFPDFDAPLLHVPGGTLRRGRPIGLESGGDLYNVEEINVAATGSYALHGLATTQIEVLFDGVPQVTTGKGFLSKGQADLDITAGPHTIAWHVNGAKDAEIGPPISGFSSYDATFNPVFGTWTLYPAGTPLSAATFVARASANARTSGYVDRVPGMTPGRAIRLLVEEAAARGVLMPALGFTDLVDSAAEPWDTFAISTRVGNDLFTFLRELSATYIDFSMRVGTFTLDAWKLGGRGQSRAVALRGPTDPDDPSTSTLHKLERKGETQ